MPSSKGMKLSVETSKLLKFRAEKLVPELCDKMTKVKQLPAIEFYNLGFEFLVRTFSNQETGLGGIFDPRFPVFCSLRRVSEAEWKIVIRYVNKHLLGVPECFNKFSIPSTVLQKVLSRRFFAKTASEYTLSGFPFFHRCRSFLYDDVRVHIGVILNLCSFTLRPSNHVTSRPSRISQCVTATRLERRAIKIIHVQGGPKVWAKRLHNWSDSTENGEKSLHLRTRGNFWPKLYFRIE